jgi:hypothetical protein
MKSKAFKYTPPASLIRYANGLAGFYGHPVFVVGSSLRSANARDIDLVCVIPDQDFWLRYINPNPRVGLKNDNVEQFWLRYMTEMYNKANWMWWREMNKKSRAGMENTRLYVDFKVFSQWYDDRYYSKLPKFRIDQMPTK